MRYQDSEWEQPPEKQAHPGFLLISFFFAMMTSRNMLLMA
jgi:hypothetical protein